MNNRKLIKGISVVTLSVVLAACGGINRWLGGGLYQKDAFAVTYPYENDLLPDGVGMKTNFGWITCKYSLPDKLKSVSTLDECLKKAKMVNVKDNPEYFIEVEGCDTINYSELNLTGDIIGAKLDMQGRKDYVFYEVLYMCPVKSQMESKYEGLTKVVSMLYFEEGCQYPFARYVTECNYLNQVAKDFVAEECNGIYDEYPIMPPIYKFDESIKGDKSFISHRICGPNRYSTALRIANEYSQEKLSNVILASATDFPDALSGSVLGAKNEAPILLVSKYEGNNRRTINYIKDNLKTSGKITVLGGENAVPNDVLNELMCEGPYNIERLGGKDRYDTNLKINANLNTKKGSDIIVANSQEFADSLSISSVAGSMQIPIYLTDNDNMEQETLDAIRNIKPNNIYVIGGGSAVSEKVSNELMGVGKVIRLGGKDRYDTSLIVAKYFNLGTGYGVVASGLNFPDALAGSVFASKINAPIILVENEVSRQKEYIDDSRIRDIYILGGNSVVSDQIVGELLRGH